MNIQELLEIWVARKMERNFYSLANPIETEYEFKKQSNHGHYAFVRFTCNPADDLSFRIADEAWQSSIPASYRPMIEAAIQEGIVETLFASLNPRRGCEIVLTSIGWHDIDSNEAAFYHAARLAMDNLVAKGVWSHSR